MHRNPLPPFNQAMFDWNRPTFASVIKTRKKASTTSGGPLQIVDCLIVITEPIAIVHDVLREALSYIMATEGAFNTKTTLGSSVAQALNPSVGSTPPTGPGSAEQHLPSPPAGWSQPERYRCRGSA